MLPLLLSLFVFASADLELNYTTEAFGEEIVEYKDADGNELEGYLVVPWLVIFQPTISHFRKADNDNKLPAVILFHAFTGRGEFDDSKARDIAKVCPVGFEEPLSRWDTWPSQPIRMGRTGCSLELTKALP